MRGEIMKKTSFFVLGAGFLFLTACTDLEEEERANRIALESKTCSQLSGEALVKEEKIKEQTRQATVSAIGAAFSTGTKAQTASLSSTLAQTHRDILKKDLNEIRLVMARKGCK